ncbi:MAG: glutamate--tRNA ligase [Phycisphaerales bacterium]|nr:glutamate--tRNA ligase [Phycisphaerales bacterium]
MTTPQTNPHTVTRFAPSPTGHLHIGGARTALLCWAFAKQAGGRFLLRIEDTDQKRSSESSTKGILEDLAWLGITWDDGPELDYQGTAIGGDSRKVGPYYQAQRIDLYNDAINRLIEEDKAYPAFETPEELEAKRKEAIAAKIGYKYDRTALQIPKEERTKRLAAGQPHVVRFIMPNESITVEDQLLGDVTIKPEEFDDFIIRKRDGFPTYHLAVTVDDALMGVTHVLRGQEHLINTPRHVALQTALGYDHPVYAHMPLIFNPDGSKMSKRDKDKAVRSILKNELDDPGVINLAARSILTDYLEIKHSTVNALIIAPILRQVARRIIKQVQGVTGFESLRVVLGNTHEVDLSGVPYLNDYGFSRDEWIEKAKDWLVEDAVGESPEEIVHFNRRLEEQKQSIVGWLKDKKSQADQDKLVEWADWFGITLPEIEVEDFRRAGYLPEALTNYLALLGWNPKTKNDDGTDLEHFSMDYLASHFSIAGMGKGQSKFDRIKLMSFNAGAIAALTDEEFASRWHHWATSYDTALAERFSQQDMVSLAPAVKTRCKTLADGRSVIGFAFIADDAIVYDGKAVHKALIKGDRKGLELLKAFREELAEFDDFTPDAIEAKVSAFAESKEVGMGKIAQPLRVAVTGAGVSPPLGQTLAILGKDATLARIDGCIEHTQSEQTSV